MAQIFGGHIAAKYMNSDIVFEKFIDPKESTL
jgi:hypothetical protein